MKQKIVNKIFYCLGAACANVFIFCTTILLLNFLFKGHAYMSEFTVGGAVTYFLVSIHYEWKLYKETT